MKSEKITRFASFKQTLFLPLATPLLHFLGEFLDAKFRRHLSIPLFVYFAFHETFSSVPLYLMTFYLNFDDR